jgi:hypothetical protein|tara:strand:+ start:57 stop:272 length:216 start_codon:yes stop_codon:yes gene_type:complete
MKESDVYEFVDVNAKRDENILTVDFYFDSDVTLDEAVTTVDTLVEADTNGLPFNGHRPSIYCLSPFTEEQV